MERTALRVLEIKPGTTMPRSTYFGEPHWLVRLYDWFEKPIVARINMMVTVVVTLILMTLANCASIEQNPATARFATQYAVAKYLEKTSEAERPAKAARVVTIASEIKRATQSQTATVATLTALAYEHIDHAILSPADRILAKGLVDFIAEELKKRLSIRELNPEDVILLTNVMDWIIAAATLSSPLP